MTTIFNISHETFEILLSEIDEKFFIKKGLYIKNYEKNLIEKFNPTIENKVEVLYRIKNRMYETPKCKCGNDLTRFSKGRYIEHCSKKCSWADEKRKELRKQNCIKKYEVEHQSKSEKVKNTKKKNNLKKYGVEHTLSLPDVKNKRKKTNLKKYGVEYYSQTSEYLKKVKNTNLENLGVEHQMHSGVVKEKIRKTNLERYGVENPVQNAEIKQKIKQTNLERYGVENPVQNTEIKQKIKQTNLERYGVEFASQSEEVKNKIKKSHKERYKRFVLPVRLKQLNDLDIYPVDWTINDYKGRNVNHLFVHTQCNKKFYGYFDDGQIPRCPYCVKRTKSKFENMLLAWLSDYVSVKSNDRMTIAPREIDLFIESKRIGIEINGIYWHQAEKEKFSLLDKTNLANEKNIQILHFWDFEIITKEQIVKSMILNKLGISKRIFARKCEVRELKIEIAKEFFNNNHLAGFVPGIKYIGLFYENELIQAMSIGKPRFNKKYDLELLRLCSKLNTTVVGGANKLFSWLKREFLGLKLISYSDLRYSTGNIYEKLGMKLIGKSKSNYFWVKNNLILSRYFTQKHKLKNILNNFNEELSENENLEINGFIKIKDCGNLIFETNF
ncbi:MAG: hypothetical protein QXN55_01775 [Candidatus Nitrosotenuis sp.]